MSQSSNNGPKLFITLLKAFALTVQRVVQSFAKESFCSKLSSLSISKFSFTAPKSCSLFGENFISFVISTTISRLNSFYLSCHTRFFPKHIACTVISLASQVRQWKVETGQRIFDSTDNGITYYISLKSLHVD